MTHERGCSCSPGCQAGQAVALAPAHLLHARRLHNELRQRHGARDHGHAAYLRARRPGEALRICMLRWSSLGQPRRRAVLPLDYKCLKVLQRAAELGGSARRPPAGRAAASESGGRPL